MENIKAIFLSGQTEITVNGLHQWDYGQQLVIQADDLPSLIEVHFACAGMTEAVVRTCTGILGTYTATIPDRCLEQTTPITAWVYCVDGTQAATVKTITLPIIARTRPQPSATVPEIITNKYTELIAAINMQIEMLSTGSTTVARAHADDDGYDFRTYYCRKGEHDAWKLATKSMKFKTDAVYQFRVKIENSHYYATLSYSGEDGPIGVATLGYRVIGDAKEIACYTISISNYLQGPRIQEYIPGRGQDDYTSSAEIYYREL